MTPAEVQALLEQIPVAAFVLSGARMVGVNHRLSQLTGVSREQFLSAEDPIGAFLAESEHQRMRIQHAARLRGEPQPEDYLLLVRGAEGHIPVRARIAPFPAAGPDAFLCLFSDERARERTTSLIREFVGAAAAALREETEPAILRVVRERLEASGLSATLSEVEPGRFRIVEAGSRNPFIAAVQARWPQWAPAEAFPMPQGSTDEGILIADLRGMLAQSLGRPRSDFAAAPPQAIVTSIHAESGPRYVLSCSGEGLDATVASAFGLLGKQLGAALETVRRIQELDQRNSELARLLDLGREVVGALDLSQVLQTAASTAARSLRCSCAYVLLENPGGAALRVAARQDPEPPEDVPVGSLLPLGVHSLSALAFQTHQAYASSDNDADARIDPEVAHRFRCRATLAVPLLSHGRALGVLALFERSGRVFGAQDIRLATHAAQLIAAAVENARLYDEQRARAEEMALLNDVARRLAGSLELRPLLELGGETLQRLLDGDLWFVLLPDAEAKGLRFRALPAGHADLAAMVLRLDSPSTAALAFKERRVVQVRDPLSSPGMASPELAARFGNRTTLAVPLIARDECLGVAVILGRNRTRIYTQAEMDRALAVAGQLALAILSARLYEDLRGSYAELARAQKELIDRERLAALGELSASIAHEVRNPLGVIFNSVGSLRRLLKPGGDVALLLDIVGEEADRLNRMVGDLLDYSRPVQPALQPVPLRPLLEEALAAARQQLGPPAEPVKVDLSVAPEVETVRADARLLRQVLINLFLNAYQAMPRGGHLEVRARLAELEGRPAAEVVMNDTGPGIPADVGPRVFLPFFTTKATGTGLGLAVVKRIVEGHGGAIELGRPPVGAEFRLRLPLPG